jgi:hypothetical protein
LGSQRLRVGRRGDSATMLAIHFGFGVVIVLAVLLYALAAAVFP